MEKTIITPRGTFKVEEYATHTWEKEEELNKQGFIIGLANWL